MPRSSKDRAAWGLVLLSLALLGTAVVGSLPPETLVITGSLLAMLVLTWLMVFWLGGLAFPGPDRPRGPPCARCGTRQGTHVAFCLRCGEERPAPSPGQADARASGVQQGQGRAPSGGR